MVKLNAKVKKWISVVSMVIVGASQITAPIDLKGMLPEFLTNNMFGNLSIIGVAAYTLLVGAFWVATKATD